VGEPVAIWRRIARASCEGTIHPGSASSLIDCGMPLPVRWAGVSSQETPALLEEHSLALARRFRTAGAAPSDQIAKVENQREQPH